MCIYIYIDNLTLPSSQAQPSCDDGGARSAASSPKSRTPPGGAGGSPVTCPVAEGMRFTVTKKTTENSGEHDDFFEVWKNSSTDQKGKQRLIDWLNS